MKVLLLFLFSTIAVSATDQYGEEPTIKFGDGSVVENPFYTGDIPEKKMVIPPGFADPNQTTAQLVNETDPAGIGTSCNIYQGELSLLNKLQEQGLSMVDSLMCLDQVNMSGLIVADMLVEPTPPMSKYLDRIEELEIPHSEKLQYQRVVRDTFRALRSGRIKTDIRNGSYQEEDDRLHFFVNVIKTCQKINL